MFLLYAFAQSAIHLRFYSSDVLLPEGVGQLGRGEAPCCLGTWPGHAAAHVCTAQGGATRCEALEGLGLRCWCQGVGGGGPGFIICKGEGAVQGLSRCVQPLALS